MVKTGTNTSNGQNTGLLLDNIEFAQGQGVRLVFNPEAYGAPSGGPVNQGLGDDIGRDTLNTANILDKLKTKKQIVFKKRF